MSRQPVRARRRRDLRELLRAVHLADRRLRQMEARIAGDDPVVVGCVAHGRDHRVTAAVRTAAEIAAVRRLPVRDADRLFRHRRQRIDGAVAVIDTRLRIDAEQRILRGAVPGIRADHREAHRERIGQRAATADFAGRGHDVAVESAVRLIEETAVPGLRQAHLEADRIGVAVDRAHALVHLAGDHAVFGNGLAGDGQRAGRRGRHRRERRVRVRELRGERVAGLRHRGRRRGAQMRRCGRHRIVAAARGEQCGRQRRRAQQFAVDHGVLARSSNQNRCLTPTIAPSCPIPSPGVVPGPPPLTA